MAVLLTNALHSGGSNDGTLVMQLLVDINAIKNSLINLPILSLPDSDITENVKCSSAWLESIESYNNLVESSMRLIYVTLKMAIDAISGSDVESFAERLQMLFIRLPLRMYNRLKFKITPTI